MNYSTAHSPVFANPANTAINLIVNFDEIGEVPFTATSRDAAGHGREIFEKAVDGEFGQVAAYAIPAASVPRSVTMRQARLALLAAGKLAAVGAAIGALPSPKKDAAQIEWEYAATVDRTSTLTELLATALSLSASQIDALFIQASTL
jgi:hypothetical protein